MKIKYLFATLLFIITCNFAGCKSEKKSNIINEDKMIDVLVDVQLAEAYLSMNRKTRDLSNIKLAPQYYLGIFNKHQISKEQFDLSTSFYKKDMSKFKILYDSVANRLERMNKERSQK